MRKGIEMEFLGYKRAEGRAGVRNHVLILPTCGCSSETARIVASQVQGSINVIINTGCADVEANTELTQRVLTGFALHPNVYAVVIIGLGCETVGHDELHKKLKAETSKPIVSFGIQEEGGTAKTIAKAVPAARALVSEASAQSRVPCPIGDLLLGLECGGSDATSGIAANPALGEVCDKLIDLGASTMLSETIEFIGAEHILANRAINKEVHNQIIQICRDYEEHLSAAGQDCRAGQPTPGNKEGGLSTLEEKSLGCIKKGGTRPIVEVLQEGVRPTKSGSLIMDTPGYDVASVTMMVAGGCQLVAFTTGRGTPTGIALAPVLKITGNHETYHHMEDNMDVDVSGITEGIYSISDGAERIFDAIVESANGRMTKAEVYGFSDICIDHICRFV
ncbi:UxaA family hydrolase [Sphaerochaeta sp. S2]|uniref:UxaA family hydrolase n=1 Tax=Sphaerochaeta sp. S2 TaxID=2798868 RepID=UPI0018E9C113|nr:UxaA family hydrolase [Sphaerochaeta sp. S2]